MGNSVSNSQQFFTITIIQGQTQSQELFDYSSSRVISQSNSLVFPSVITSNIHQNSERINYSQVLNPQQTGPLSAQFKFQLGGYREIILENCSMNLEQKNVWRVIKQNELLEQGDILKIGKVKLQIKEIALDKKKVNQVQRQHTEHNQSRTIRQKSIGGSHLSREQQCRVCFEGTESVENPLVCLCKCSGSVKFIHFQCLKDWIANNVVKRESPNCVNYTYYQSNCELCKQQLENQFIHQGKKYTLFHTETLSEPYVRLQGHQIDLTGKKKLSVYLIRLIENTEILIGRNNVSDVTMKDISVSRTHCSLFFKNRMLFLSDKKSKFGTLIKMRNQFQFNSIQGVELQYQSQLIRIEQTRVIKNCCCAEPDTYIIKLVRGTDQYRKQIEADQEHNYKSMKTI